MRPYPIRQQLIEYLGIPDLCKVIEDFCARTLQEISNETTQHARFDSYDEGVSIMIHPWAEARVTKEWLMDNGSLRSLFFLTYPSLGSEWTHLIFQHRWPSQTYKDCFLYLEFRKEFYIHRYIFNVPEVSIRACESWVSLNCLPLLSPRALFPFCWVYDCAQKKALLS